MRRMTGSMRRIALAAAAGGVVVLFATAHTSAVPRAAAAAPAAPYTVSFDSTEVNNFLGQDGGQEPSGTETNEYTASVPLAAGNGGAFTGTADGSYAQASGTLTAITTCTGGAPGTTTETETGGNGAPVTASLSPGTDGRGGTLSLTFATLSGQGIDEPTENYEDSSTCGGSAGNTTPRWMADFTYEHQSELTNGATFQFTLPLTAGTDTTAGTYTFSGEFTQGNLDSTEDTTITVTETPCDVPDVVNEPQASAESDLQSAGCTVGAVTKQKSKTVPKGNVISSNPAAGQQLQPGAPVALVVSLGKKHKKSKVKCVVPNVKGDTIAAARPLIKAGHCAVGTITFKKSSAANKGLVLSQSPPAGSVHKKGTKVNLTVGKHHS
jgi:hypothetical protein